MRAGLGRTPIYLEDGTLRLFGDQLQEVHRFKKPEPGMRFHSVASGWHSNIWVTYRFEPDNKALFLWWPEGEETRGVFLEHPDKVFNFVFTLDDRFLITDCLDRVIRFWRTSDGGLERTVALPDAAEGFASNISPDGKTALWVGGTSPQPQRFQFLDLESGKVIGDPQSGFQASETIFSPNTKQIAFLDSNGPVTVLEARTGRVISTSILHSGILSWMEWNPDGRRLLTAGNNDEVLVWDVETGAQLLGPLQTPGAFNRFARWSPDGRYIITRNDDKKVRVWDATTGEAVTPLLKHSGDVAFAFMTRSNRLITGTFPDLLRAWDLKETPLPSDVLADYAKLLSGRHLNAADMMLALQSEELAELNRSLRARAPQLFE